MNRQTLSHRMFQAASMMAVACCVFLLASGCASYHFGVSLPEAQRCIAVEAVENLTTEPILATLTRDALIERFSQLPGVSVANGESAGLRVKVKLVSLVQDGLARAHIRDSADRQGDEDAYQTVLYRLTLRAEWQATPTQGDGTTPPRTGVAVGTADMSLTADKETAMRTALRQAALELARNIAADVAD